MTRACGRCRAKACVARMDGNEAPARHDVLAACGRGRRPAPAQACRRAFAARLRRPRAGARRGRSGCSATTPCASPRLSSSTRIRNIGPAARRPGEELHGLRGIARLRRQVPIVLRALLPPDASVLWNVTAIPAARRIVKRERVDVVLTTSPPGSVHLVGLAVGGWASRGSPTSVTRSPRTHTVVGHTRGGCARAAGGAKGGCDRRCFGRDRHPDARDCPSRLGYRDPERLRLRRLRGACLPAGPSFPDHAHGWFRRTPFPAPLPGGPRPFRGGRHRPLRRGLPGGRPRVGPAARAGRPARARSVSAAWRGPRAPAGLGGAAPDRPGR